LQAVPFKRFFKPPPKSENFAVSPNHQLQADFHDFPDEFLGKALPYGVYDVTMNQGWVSVGISHALVISMPVRIHRHADHLNL
jgi:Rhodopirellula transposase DDE domain